jgi:hypothetical protein
VFRVYRAVLKVWKTVCRVCKAVFRVHGSGCSAIMLFKGIKGTSPFFDKLMWDKITGNLLGS